MKRKNILLNFIIGTLLSALIFFSISFITFLKNINPIHKYNLNETYHLEVGFPYTYYYEFLSSGANVPNSGWKINLLFFDCLLIWVTTVGLFMYLKLKIRKKS